jgi:hypothetical protein
MDNIAEVLEGQAIMNSGNFLRLLTVQHVNPNHSSTESKTENILMKKVPGVIQFYRRNQKYNCRTNKLSY